jgi:hypothetical protein
VSRPAPQHAFPSQQSVPHGWGFAVGQPQVLLVQTCSPVHACPQVPQFATSVDVSTQTVEQFA